MNAKTREMSNPTPTIDLTGEGGDEVPARHPSSLAPLAAAATDRNDHMHAVINYLDKVPREPDTKSPKTEKKATTKKKKPLDSTTTAKRKASMSNDSQNPQSSSSSTVAFRMPGLPSPVKGTDSMVLKAEKPTSSPPNGNDHDNPVLELSSGSDTPPSRRDHRRRRHRQSQSQSQSGNQGKIFHLFLSLPPELRNNVYRILLTTPGNTPIELPRLTGARGRQRAREWTECDTPAKRRRHKSLFLEILQTSKQVHGEASGILYGCNVFKWYCNLGDGPATLPGTTLSSTSMGTALSVLPPRRLHLLKHVKVAVITRNMSSHADTKLARVAQMVRCFAARRQGQGQGQGEEGGLVLESFELTWYGWERCRLEADSEVVRALLGIRAERAFVIKVLGEARMRKATQVQLEKNLQAEKVEIQRPVVVGVGEVELSEDDDE